MISTAQTNCPRFTDLTMTVSHFATIFWHGRGSEPSMISLALFSGKKQVLTVDQRAMFGDIVKSQVHGARDDPSWAGVLGVAGRQLRAGDVAHDEVLAAGDAGTDEEKEE